MRVRPHARLPTVVALLAAVLTLAAAPAAAHSTGIKHDWNKHYKPSAKKIFYTKSSADARFLGVGATAADADLLDGLDSGAFAAAGHTHAVSLEHRTRAATWHKAAPDTLAGSTTAEVAVFVAPTDLTVTDAFVVPSDALVASDTNYATLVVSRRDQDGGGRVTIASETTQTAGVGGSGSWTAFAQVSLGALSNTSLSAGQAVTFEITKAGIGVSAPVLAVQVEYTVD